MTRFLLALALMCWPGAALAKFAPVEGQALRFTVAEDRAGTRFTSERRITFHKAEQGYTADLTIVSVDAAGGERDIGAMARRVMNALVGRTIRYQLNDAGMVVTVDDQDTLMTVLATAFSAMGGAGKDASPERQAVANRAAAAIGALPYDSQRLLLASLLTPVVGGALSEAKPGEMPITLPANSPMGQSAMLSGRQTVTLGAAGRIVIDSDVSGPGPAGDAPTTLRIVQHREIDPATGLVLVNERRTDTWITAKPEAVTTIRSASTLTPVL